MTFSSYQQFIEQPSTEKITLVHLHMTKRAYNFSLDGSTYSRDVEYVVSEVQNGSLSLSKVNSIGLLTDDTKFFYDLSTGKLHLYSFDNDNDEIIVTYRLFLSDAPINLSWDLTDDNGQEVTYDARIISTPKFKSQMTQGKKSISLIGSGSVVVENTDGYWDDIYDSYIFDNKKTEVYSFHRDLQPTQAKKIFRGFVTGKLFGTTKVTFSVVDDIYSLEQQVSGSQYLDEVAESDRLNFKRIVYGKLSNLRVQSLDQVGDGITVTGVITGSRGQSFLKGTGTNFLAELSEDDKLIIGEQEFTVDRVVSDTLVVIGDEVEINFSNSTALVQPNKSYSNTNRRFQVSSHAIKKYQTTITAIIARNRIEVDNVDGFQAGDLISINSVEKKYIKRISGNQIILKSNYNIDHSIGASIDKDEIFNVKYGKQGLSASLEDITIDNSSSGCFLVLDSDTEINSAIEKNLSGEYNFFQNIPRVWFQGLPTFVDITGVANTSNSLLGKWFRLVDASDNGIALWFTDNVPDGNSLIPEPDHGQNSSFPIKLDNRDYSEQEIANLILETITVNVDTYEGYLDGNIAKIYTTSTAFADGSGGPFGDAGITPSYTTGSVTDSKKNLKDELSVRDYIKVASESQLDYYEVLSVNEDSIRLRIPYTETSKKTKITYKSVEYINDDTEVIVDCYGKTKDNTPSGDFIETIPETVKDILIDAGMLAFLDEATFDSAVENAPQLIALALPYSFSGEMPDIKGVINKLNTSVLGSLFVTQELELGYDILDANLDIDNLRTIADDDVLNWSIKGDSFDITRKVVGNYNFKDFVPSNDGEGFDQVEHESEFVDKYVGSKNTREIDLYLSSEEDAQEQVERDELINSLANTTIQVNGSINLSKYKIGERVVLSFRRLYRALGSTSRVQVGIITSIDNTGTSVKLEIQSLGALYSRAAIVTEDSATDNYIDASDFERVEASYIVEDNGIIGTDENTNLTSLIS